MSKFAEYYASLVQLCVLYLTTLGFTQSRKVTIDNSTCLLKVFEISDERSTTVLWDGRALMKNCRIGFRLSDEEDHNFAIEIKKYIIEDCSFTLSYFYADTSVAKKNFSCKSSPRTHRVDNVQYLYVQFDTSGASKSTVELKVFGEKHGGWSGWIGIVITIIVVAVFYFYMKKKNKNVCDVLGDCRDCCCGLVEALSRSCRAQARECSRLWCSSCEDSSNSATTQQATSQSEPQSETGAETTDPSRRSTVSTISVDITSVDDVTLVEGPTAPPPPPGFASNYDPPSYACPPPSYEDCIKGGPPPSYPGSQ